MRNALGWICGAVCTGVILVVLVSAAGLGWGSSGLRFKAPANLQEAWTNAGNALASLWAGPSQLVEPLTTAYGSMLTIGVVAGIVVLSGVFFVARGQQ